ncbi:MAG TPA: hypothetical protein VJM11_01740 [Nevskiaceae bacterium]|nr:hypothetical protein [Nevskiaceae bacterium]
MRIQSSEIAFESAHRREDRLEQRVELRIARPPPAPRPDTVSLSERAIQAGAVEASDAGEAAPGSDDGLPPGLSLVKMLLEYLLGKSIDIFDAAKLHGDADAAEATPAEAPPPPARAQPSPGAALEATATVTRVDSEATTVGAEGIVRTADGREIRFELHLDLERYHAETTSVTIETGAPKKKDPLVINFGGTAAQLTSDRIEFDLDADGIRELIPNVTSASGFLALDRNGDGRINDGRELFGTASGDGFADLSALDGDGNGWIDEGDAAWSQLRVWRRDGDTDALRTLEQAGVGALYLGRVASTFEHRDADNQALGELRSTGVYLAESGKAGTLQQLDLFV